MQENNFLWCLRNPCENTFSKLQIFAFFFKEEFQKDVRVLAVCNTQHFVEKTGYFNTRFVFPQYKK